jgi:four helix bundle protein
VAGEGTTGSTVLSHHDLVVWQRAVDLVTAVYECTAGFPKAETFGLASQLRRAAVSVCANIAEGRGRETTRDYLHFLSIAYGSLMETDALVHVAFRLGFVDREQLDRCLKLASEVGRMLVALRKSLRGRLKSGPSGPSRT